MSFDHIKDKSGRTQKVNKQIKNKREKEEKGKREKLPATKKNKLKRRTGEKRPDTNITESNRQT